ncbi:MAG: hypothetical protein ACTHK4_04245 [Mycobacteriales bacterium]
MITIVARGSRITELTSVRLRHCVWNLGSAQTKEFPGGRDKLRIVVTRRHRGTKGLVRFHIVDTNGQEIFLSAHV